MFRASWTSPYKGEVKTLRFHRNPIRHGLGHYRDVDGFNQRFAAQGS